MEKPQHDPLALMVEHPERTQTDPEEPHRALRRCRRLSAFSPFYRGANSPQADPVALAASTRTDELEHPGDPHGRYNVIFFWQFIEFEVLSRRGWEQR